MSASRSCTSSSATESCWVGPSWMSRPIRPEHALVGRQDLGHRPLQVVAHAHRVEHRRRCAPRRPRARRAAAGRRRAGRRPPTITSPRGGVGPPGRPARGTRRRGQRPGEGVLVHPATPRPRPRGRVAPRRPPRGPSRRPRRAPDEATRRPAVEALVVRSRPPRRRRPTACAATSARPATAASPVGGSARVRDHGEKRRRRRTVHGLSRRPRPYHGNRSDRPEEGSPIRKTFAYTSCYTELPRRLGDRDARCGVGFRSAEARRPRRSPGRGRDSPGGACAPGRRQRPFPRSAPSAAGARPRHRRGRRGRRRRRGPRPRRGRRAPTSS